MLSPRSSPHPTNLRSDINEALLIDCCAVEDENSFDRHAVAVLKDGRVVGHIHMYMLPCFAKHSR